MSTERGWTQRNDGDKIYITAPDKPGRPRIGIAVLNSRKANAEANAQLIVDCVNGCKDIENPLAVTDLYKVCKAIWEAYSKARLDYGAELLAEISKLDTLLAKAEGR